MSLSKIRTALAISLFAAVVAPIVACSGTDDHHSEVSATQTAPLCYVAGSPEIASGLVSESEACSCPAEETELAAALTDVPDPDDGNIIAEAPEVTNSPDSPYSMAPAHHDKKGGSCGTGGFCKQTWTSLKQLAACLGIACAIAGGGNGTVTKAVTNLARAVCCATDRKAHETASSNLSNEVRAACGGDGG